MPTTRPGYIWSGTEWIAIGQEAAVNPFKYQATAPTSPATGDIWVDSDDFVPSIDSAQFLRWRKTMAGGETSLSGNDDASLALAYTPGYEQLYINGVLQVRGQDYTATTGTTVTGLTALVANDTVEVFSAVARAVADVYTQTQSDARFVNQSVAGLTLIKPTSSTNGTIGTNGAVSVSAVTSVTINGCFTSAYENYLIVTDVSNQSTTSFHYLKLTVSGTPSGSFSTVGWDMSVAAGTGGSSNLGTGNQAIAYAPVAYAATGGQGGYKIDIFRPQIASFTGLTFSGAVYGNDTGMRMYSGSSIHYAATSFDGFSLTTNAGNFTGTIRIYGYNNG